jgi:hypothetical protein
MSSNPTWERDANGVEHPLPETLLAFMREQCFEHEKSRINEHLLTGCVPCSKVREGLTPGNNALDQLQYMSRYLYYPELQSNQVLLHAQSGEPLTSVWTGKRKRKFQTQSRLQITRQNAHKKSVRIISVPAAFALFLVFMTAVLVLAYSVVNSGFQIPNPGQIFGGFTNPEPNATGLAPHLSAPTAGAITPSPTASAILTPIVTATVVQGPAIINCLSAGYTGMAIVICGIGFQANDSISLKVDYYGSNALKTVGPFTARGGEFKVSWSVPCRNFPVTIYAVDETQHTMTTALTISARFGCSWPTPTVTPHQNGHQ